MKKNLSFFIALLFLLLADSNESHAQQYKLRQSTGVMGMKSESTIYVKGMRKRTETAGMMGMSIPTTIEQCDKQRTIKINDKKKLYFIEPFAKEDVIDEDVKPAATKTKPVPEDKTVTKKGGTIYMYYNITDTGERKKMNGFTARHIWTTQKIKPSADACMMKDSMIIKTDGWYIDLPEFNCPVRYTPSTSAPTEQKKPDCMDKFVTKRSGKGKLGFPLTETRTIIMNDQKAKTSEFSTNLETLEFASMKLDSMLFEIPLGYTQTTNEADLQDKFDMADVINQYKDQAKNNKGNATPTEEKKTGGIRIGVFQPQGSEQLQGPTLQQHLATLLSNGNIEAIAVENAADAKKFNCDYTLTTDFTRVKQASKVGGLLKAIKNTDPNAATSFNIDATLTLISLTDGSVKTQPKVSGKYEGKPDDAAMKALDEGSRLVLKGLK